jgi:hypothetical protein
MSAASEAASFGGHPACPNTPLPMARLLLENAARQSVD